MEQNLKKTQFCPSIWAKIQKKGTKRPDYAFQNQRQNK